MITRRSVWSSERIQRLLGQFVPVADEVYRLHHGKEAESDFFRLFCELGHYKDRGPRETRQGLYAVTPRGEFLASCNTRSARRVERMLRLALQRWEAISPERRGPDAKTVEALGPSQRLEHRYPEGGLVLCVESADLPGVAGQCDWHEIARNRDYLWFRAEEAREFVPVEAQVGMEHAVPPAWLRRMARTALVDNVRGQTSSFKADEVVSVALTAAVVAIDGPRVVLQLEGHSHTRSGNGSEGRGVRVRLLGDAVYDREAALFVGFELVAVGTRWGATPFNEREGQLEATGVGFVLRQAEDSPAQRVAPAGIWSYGW